MTKTATKIFGLLIVGLLGVGAWWVLRDQTGPVPVRTGETAEEEPAASEPEPEVDESGAAAPEGTAPVARVADEIGAPAEPAVPDSYRAALAGVTGRVVEEDGTPIAGLEVTLLELRVDSLFTGMVGILSQEEMLIETGSGHTDAEGRFLIPGASPHGRFGGLGVDLGGPRGTLRVVEHSLHSAETTDVGDVVLAPHVTFLGKVIDAGGNPVAGARVRATDLPAIIFQGGVQHYREGRSLVVVEDEEQIVFELPAWLARFERRLPLPTTVTEQDGSFRLEGVPQGIITVIADREGFVSTVKQGIPAGRRPERDVGAVVLGRGRTLTGEVLDVSGEPVAGAEVFAGVMVPVGFVAIAAPAQADEKGRFAVSAMPEVGATLFAARRGPGHAWVVAGPAGGSEAPPLVLPAGFNLTLKFRDEAGKPVSGVKLKVVATGMDSFGAAAFFRPSGQLATIAGRQFNGEAVIPGLPAGHYVVTASSEGFADAVDTLAIEEGDAELELTFRAGVTFLIAVVDRATEEAVPHALVGLQSAAAMEDFFSMGTILSTRTDAEGRARIGPLGFDEEVEELVLTAQHPAYAYAALQVSPEQTQPRIELVRGGSIEGNVHIGGRAPGTPFMIVVMPDFSARGTPFGGMPRFAVSDLEGRFRVTGLGEGSHSVMVMERFLNVDPSSLAQRIAKDDEPEELAETEVEVRTGEVTEVSIDLGPALSGAVATLRGRVSVNGQPVEGWTVRTDGSSRHHSKSAATDDDGRYEIPELAIGPVEVTVYRDQWRWQVFETQVELIDGALETLDVDVREYDVPILVVDPAGSPVANAMVTLHCTEEAAQGAGDRVRTNSEGRVTAKVVAVGHYHLGVDHNEAGQGAITVAVPASGVVSEVRVVVDPGVRLSGRALLEGFPTGERTFSYVVLLRSDGEGGFEAEEYEGLDSDGRFAFSGLTEGDYQLQANVGGEESELIPLYLGGAGILDQDFVFRPKQ